MNKTFLNILCQK